MKQLLHECLGGYNLTLNVVMPRYRCAYLLHFNIAVVPLKTLYFQLELESKDLMHACTQ